MSEPLATPSSTGSRGMVAPCKAAKCASCGQFFGALDTYQPEGVRAPLPWAKLGVDEARVNFHSL